jgi:hypothetical protein
MVDPAPELCAIDTDKRYDVYCREHIGKVVVYRNALFKSRKKLLSMRPMFAANEFLEVEQGNGQAVYLSRFSVVKFCEPGTAINAEPVG